ncbi:UNVERIFIED_CONTAM: hypothetical protein HDU68_006887 [Siphonaria sp. JEL0065]|nr:hypothetical protein HDU68_006887 [Siphonaria sp. JEL0065]
MFVLPSDQFAATGNFKRNSINHTDGKNVTVKDSHYQCSYLLHWPFETPDDGDSSIVEFRLVVAEKEHVEEVKALLLTIMEPCRGHKGCIRYELQQGIEDPTDFTFVEEWESEELLNEHFSDPIIQDTIAKFPGIVESGPEVRRYHLIG